MAKKVVASLRDTSGVKYAKLIQSVKSKKTGSYVFKEEIIMEDHVKDILAGKSQQDIIRELRAKEKEAEAAKQAEDSGAFLIDINMGCPVKKIAKKGGGSALIKDRKLAIELVKNVVKAVRVPVTVKTRLGWESKEENIEDFLFKLQDAGATMITLHGRTRKQGFSGKSDWEMIGRLKK